MESLYRYVVTVTADKRANPVGAGGQGAVSSTYYWRLSLPLNCSSPPEK